MNKYGNTFAAVHHKALCGVLLLIINLLLWFHNYPIALLLLINILVLGYVALASYRSQISKNHSINLIETLLLSIKNGEVTVRADNVSDPTLVPIASHLNDLAQTIKLNQSELASQKALLTQIIDSIDSALLVFDKDGLAFANKYAIVTFAHCYQNDPHTWYEQLLASKQQGSVIININNHAHTFLIESQRCYVKGQEHTLLVLKQLDNILYAQEKEALTRFVRILSHEINNTLAPIGTVSRSLKKRLATNLDIDQFQDGLSLINERALYLKRFMDNYVSLAKLPNPNKQVVACETLCNELAQAYPNLTITGASALIGYFDQSQIKQVLCHLINNAKEAGENIIVSLNLTPLNDKLLFEVSDNGPGFSNQHEAMMPFYTTKAQGTGVGLMLSKSIVSNHGFQLMLENLIPNGAKVSFCVERLRNNDVISENN